jgi:hypothetical protein
MPRDARSAPSSHSWSPIPYSSLATLLRSHGRARLRRMRGDASEATRVLSGRRRRVPVGARGLGVREVDRRFLPRASQRIRCCARTRRGSARRGQHDLLLVPSRDTVARWADETPGDLPLRPQAAARGHARGRADSRASIARCASPSGCVRSVRAWGESSRSFRSRTRRIRSTTCCVSSTRGRASSHSPSSPPPRLVRRAWAARLAHELARRDIGRAILDTREIWREPRRPVLGAAQEAARAADRRRALRRPRSSATSAIRCANERGRAVRVVAARRRWLRGGIDVTFAVHCPIEDESPRSRCASKRCSNAAGARSGAARAAPARRQLRPVRLRVRRLRRSARAVGCRAR